MSTVKCPIEPIPDDWRVMTLSQLATKIGSGATPRGGEEAYLKNRANYVLVRSQNVFDRYFDDSGIAYISDSDAAKLKGVELQRNDVLLNITGDGITFARATIVPDEILPAVVNQHVCIIRCDTSQCMPGYVLSYLNHKSVKYYMESFNAGGSRRALTKGNIESFLIPIPPLGEQVIIAVILSSLDEKIELNRKQNCTLEAIAQALFKRWFVEFEFPDENGRPYKSSGGAMQPSELGEIPVGWEVPKVGDAIEILGGGTPSTGEEEYWTDGQIDWYSPTDLTKSGALFSFGSAKRITEQGLANSSAKLFPEYSLMMTSRATIGVISINSKAACTNQGFITLIPNDEYPLYVLHGWLLQQLPEVHAKASGSTFKEISRGTFKSFDILKSPIATKYQELVEPIYQKIESNLKESELLAGIRDTLLPKLMSGELRVA